MKIQKVTSDKKEYLDLLLLADEQEDMIDRYLERGEMFILNQKSCHQTRASEKRLCPTAHPISIYLLPGLQNHVCRNGRQSSYGSFL